MAGLTHHLRRAGVCVATGYGIRLFVQRGQLVVEDGVGRDRRRRVYSRATHGISRLVVIGTEGFISLEAIRWLQRLGISLIHLDRDATLLASSAVAAGDARLRRLQAVAGESPLGVEIARRLMQSKLAGQARVLDLLSPTATIVAAFGQQLDLLDAAGSLDEVLAAEREAAQTYWAAWGSLPVRFRGADAKAVPEYWLVFGQRGSLLTGAPRLAINPANALLNYLYALLEAETRNACLIAGLDPGLGIVHVDYRNRDSFALDLMEAVRPDVDAYVLELLQTRIFKRKDFAETVRGVCRINPPLSHELGETAPHWGSRIAPIVESVAAQLAAVPGSRVAALTTPLTGSNRSQSRNRKRPKPASRLTPRPPETCKTCGDPVPARQRFYCDDCLPARREEHDKGLHKTALAAIKARRDAGDDPTHGGTAAQKRAVKNRARKAAEQAWEARHDKPDPAIFLTEILPAIQAIPTSRLEQATGLSRRYIAMIRRGEHTPHPRHWPALRNLTESQPVNAHVLARHNSAKR
jgi:CRISPR-associated endonuclease Cas1